MLTVLLLIALIVATFDDDKFVGFHCVLPDLQFVWWVGNL